MHQIWAAIPLGSRVAQETIGHCPSANLSLYLSSAIRFYLELEEVIKAQKGNTVNQRGHVSWS